jgi:hypothetical protein
MPTLKAQIDAFNEEKAKQMPEDILETMNRATINLKSQKFEDKSLKVGDIAPGFDLADHNKKRQSLKNYLDGSMLVLSFYRGGW